jgi:hypothetical protein
MHLAYERPLVNGVTLAAAVRVDSWWRIDRGPQFRGQTPVPKVENLVRLKTPSFESNSSQVHLFTAFPYRAGSPSIWSGLVA